MSPPQVGLAAKSQAALQDGSIAYPGQFPWHAGVFRSNTLLGSGALVSKQHILTAASTVVGNPKAEEVKVLLDSVTKFKGGNLPLSDIITHMDWDKDTNENDIAILVLESPVLDTFVPVRLPARYYEGATYVDQTLSVTGWGHADGSSEPYLSVSNVAVIRNRDCQSQQHQSQQLPWTKMCAVSSGPTPCLDDGGDPVVFLENDTKYTLVGILTPDAQCSTQRPSTITRITEFLDWIDQASGGKIPIED